MLSRYDLLWWIVPVCLKRSGSKYRYFIWAKRSTARRSVMVHSARRALISFIWCRTTQWTRESKLNQLNNRNFLLHALSLATSVPRAQVTFSSEPSLNLLWATIVDIISTSCAHVLSLRRARSLPPHAVRDCARAFAGPSTFWCCARQRVSLRAANCYY